MTCSERSLIALVVSDVCISDRLGVKVSVIVFDACMTNSNNALALGASRVNRDRSVRRILTMTFIQLIHFHI